MPQTRTAWDFIQTRRPRGPREIVEVSSAIAAAEPQAAIEPYVSVDNLAQRLGLPEAALESLARTGKIRHLKIGRRRETFFRVSYVQADLRSLELASLRS